MMTMQFINVADLVANKETGETYRQLNIKKKHNIPIGTLVEIDHSESEFDDEREADGVRLFVMDHTRDCDGTPLYSLGIPRQYDYGVIKGLHIDKGFHGYAEENLIIIKEVKSD